MRAESRRLELSCLVEGGKTVVLFYDLTSEVLVDDLTDYTIFLSSDSQLDHKTVSNHGYHLRRFWEFLAARGKTAADTTDALLEEFRDTELAAVLSSGKSKRDKRIAKGTVNERLCRIYHWLKWLLQQGRATDRLVGATGCQVRSSLLEDEERASEGRRGGHRSARLRAAEHRKYPLLFRNVGTGSKHRTRYVPSDQVRHAAISYLHEHASSDYLAHRNALLIDIVDAAGWRRASVNSLTVPQIRQANRAQSGSGYVPLSPESQKFGYTETFDVPAWLTVRIAHFIDHYLKALAESKGWKTDVEASRLFLTSSGRPLTDRTITQIISRAMRAVGAPSWSAMHALRRKFTNDDISDETEYRLARGLDTSAASITASVSLRLGQHDPESVYAYVSKELTAGRLMPEATRRAHLAAVEDENLALKARLRQLEAENTPAADANLGPAANVKPRGRRKPGL